MPTPADELRAAADRLRKLATAASTDRHGRDTSTWISEQRSLTDGQLRTPDGISLLRGGSSGPGGRRGLPPRLNPQHAAYIAAMDPALGLVLADWLDGAARGWDALNYAADMALNPDDPAHAAAAEELRGGPYDAAEALAVGRLINREQQ